jgi:hypothetical protein
MAEGAVSFSTVKVDNGMPSRNGPLVVHHLSNRLQMNGVYAPTVLAEMVKGESIRDWPYKGFVADTMDQFVPVRTRGARYHDMTIAMFIQDAFPLPAAILQFFCAHQ